MTKLPAKAKANHVPSKVQHPGHRHTLKLVPNNDGVRFRCNGCNLRGAGARYECERGLACNQDFHIRCALAPAQREIGGYMFVLHRSSPGCGRICDACGSAATGFTYHCADLDHDVHPCCADLPETLELAGVFLELRMKDDDAPQRHCPICPDPEKKTWWGGRRHVNRGCWSYRSVRGTRGNDDHVFLHVACARDLACDSFTDVTGTRSVVVHGPRIADRGSFANASVGNAMASPTTGTRSVVVHGSRIADRRSFTNASQTAGAGAGAGSSLVGRRSDQEMVMVKASALRALLLKGQGRGDSGGGRTLRVLGFIVRVVIGVIFGDPTAMFVAIGQALF